MHCLLYLNKSDASIKFGLFTIIISSGSKSGSYTIDNGDIISAIPTNITISGAGIKPNITSIIIYSKTITITINTQQLAATTNIYCNLFYLK